MDQLYQLGSGKPLAKMVETLQVSTPLIVKQWVHSLSGHLVWRLTHGLRLGTEEGFQIGSDYINMPAKQKKAG